MYILSSSEVERMHLILNFDYDKVNQMMSIIRDKPNTMSASESYGKIQQLVSTFEIALDSIPNKYIALSYSSPSHGPGCYFVDNAEATKYMMMHPSKLIENAHLRGEEIISRLNDNLTTARLLIGMTESEEKSLISKQDILFDKESGLLHFKGQQNQFQALMVLALWKDINQINEAEYRKVYKPLLHRINIRNREATKTKVLYPDPRGDIRSLDKSYTSDQVSGMVKVVKAFLTEFSEKEK